MAGEQRAGVWHKIAPALSLIVAAPLVAEVLPGATRVSAIFVFPIEMAVWGIGALFIRAAVRYWRLCWANMLLLAFALSLAEELLIQQTSLAPLVIQIVKGEAYARAFGINWLYLIWALGYESVLVVLVPVMLTELIFPKRREAAWVSKGGVIVCAIIFAVGCFFAWFSWTQIARVKVFHLPAYTPPLFLTVLGGLLIAILLFSALGPFARGMARPASPLPPPPAFVIGLFAAVLAVLWYALVIAAFRAWPNVPPHPLALGGVVLAITGGHLFGRWSAHPDWTAIKRYGVVSGAMIGSMAVGFVGFIGAGPLDLYGKAALDLIAVILLLILGQRLTAAASR